MTQCRKNIDYGPTTVWGPHTLNYEDFCLADAGEQWFARHSGVYGVTLYFAEAMMFMSASGDCVVFLEPGACYQRHLRPAYLRVAA